jgi:HTH-type transcriptional regulator, sugar sensing transcriptional regulator
MPDEEQISRLAQLGLNAYEARAYLALLGKESFSASQVADLSGVPRQRIYDILASLVDQGLAVSRPGRRGTKYAAVAPGVALQALLGRAKQQVTALEVATNSLIATLASQYAAGKEETSPLEYIEVLRGTAAISERFSEIQANCRREILVFTKPPYATPPQENVEGLETLQRRVRACSIYEYDVLRDPATRAGVAYFIRQGEQARFVAHLPMKLVVVDEAIVMFAMEDPIAGRTDLTIMVIENPQLAAVLKIAFETLWTQGETFEAACARLGLPVPGTEPAKEVVSIPQ